MNTYYCVVKLDEDDFASDREVGFVVASSYQDAARKLEEYYGKDLEAITYMAIITDSDVVMMDAEHCPTMETTLKEIKKAIEDSERNDVIIISGRGNRSIFCKDRRNVEIYLDRSIVEEIIKKNGVN